VKLRKHQTQSNALRTAPDRRGHVTSTEYQQDNTSFAGSGNQPLEHGVEVGLLFCTDAVAAHFSVRHGLEVERLDELVDGKLVGQVRFVAQDEKRNAF
jgi:hypothetical protein